MKKQHAHEIPLGHLQRHHTRNGTVIRFHRPHRISDEVLQARPAIEPVEVGWGEVFKIISMMLVIAVVYIAVGAMIVAQARP